jgi:hypothetical protein
MAKPVRAREGREPYWRQIDDHPSARHVVAPDREPPHRQAALGPATREGRADRHRVVGRVGDSDRTRDLSIPDGAGPADAREAFLCQKRMCSARAA